MASTSAALRTGTPIVPAAILFDLARRGMTLFVSMFPTYQLVYGAFAAVPIFLIWILVSWNILLVGAEIVQAMTNFKVNKQRSTSSLGNLLAILESLYRLQGRGEMIEEVDLLQGMPWISSREWENYTDTLINVPLIHRSGEGQISLTRDLHKYTLAQLFRDCFGDTVKLDLHREDGWQGKVSKLYKSGLEDCLNNWEIPLSELFDEVDEGRPSLSAVATTR